MSTDDRMETITDPAEIRATDDPDERTTPAPVGDAVALDLDAIEARAMLNAANTIKATGGAVEIGGVRIEPCDEYGSTVTTARAESAEAEVGTLRDTLARRTDSHTQLVRENEALRARLAAVEALTVDWPCSDDTCDGDCTGCAYASDLRAALAVTTGEGECSNCRQPLTAEPCSQPDGNGGKVTGHWVAGGPCEAPR